MQTSSPNVRGRILCTEDDPDTRELITWVLTKHDFVLTCCESADVAIDLAKSRWFDLYLVDHRMPHLSGTDLAKRLREFDADTPILFYTAAAYEADKEAAYMAGAHGYLVKPVPNDDLVTEVKRLTTAKN